MQENYVKENNAHVQWFTNMKFFVQDKRVFKIKWILDLNFTNKVVLFLT